MAKFNYKMQNILNIKYNLETQAKSEYAQANEELRQEELKLDAICADINRYQDEIRSMREGSVNITELRRCSQAIEIKKEQAKSQAVQIKNAQIKVDKTRKKLSDVMVDRKTHEKLREKAFGEFLSELDDSEKKEIDELVSFRFKNEDDN